MTPEQLTRRMDLDQLILDEVNVRQLVRIICSTDQGYLMLVYEGPVKMSLDKDKPQRYFLELDGKEIDAPRLLAAILAEPSVFSLTKDQGSGLQLDI